MLKMKAKSNPASGELERGFQDIPENKSTEAEQTAFLMNLSSHRGLTWTDLLQSRRVLIISEAGAGKTYECRRQQEGLWAAGEPAFYVELAELARSDLASLLSGEEEARLSAWHTAQSDVATFFLDSVDELKLSLGSFEVALKRLAKAIDGQLHRVRIVITSRPIPIDEQLFRKTLPIPEEPEEAATSEEFANIVMSRHAKQKKDTESTKDWRNVALLPLTTDQIKLMAIGQGVSDPDALVADIRQRNAEEFARRPQDLIELCADWREHRRIRTHRDQVATNVSTKLKPRSDGREKAELAPAKAIMGARRLALAATLSRKLTLRHSAEADREGDEAEAPLDPAIILHDWSPAERTTLLERSLFGFASYGRVRFHHRSVIEYLSAVHLLSLRDKGMPLKNLKRMLFTRTAQGDAVVKPSLRPVAAWLALEDAMVFDEVLRREPDVLLNYGDPESLAAVQRQRALRAFVERFGGGGWRGLRVPEIQLHRFASPDLGAEVGKLWASGVENEEVREILLALIGHGKMVDCAGIAFAVAKDSALGSSERIGGLEALIELGDSRLEQIGQALRDDSERWPNRLAINALLRLFPKHMSIETFCAALARVNEAENSVGSISWHLPRIAEQVPLAMLDSLREGLTNLLVENARWDEDQWPNLVSQRPFLSSGIAAICLRQINAGVQTAAVMRSAALALHLRVREYSTNEEADTLAKVLRTASPEARRLAFEAEDAFLQELSPQNEPFKRFVRITHRGGLELQNSDLVWVFEALGDRERASADRAMLLEAAIRLRDADTTWLDHLEALKAYVADLPDLVSSLEDKAKPSPHDPELERMEKDAARRKKQHERKEAKAHASWVMFWREIANNPDAMFTPDKSENTTWNLWRVMERSGDESRASGWNRRFVERNFGSSVADRMRSALMAYWRKEKPTLRSERPESEKGTYFTHWQLGLAGIAAESEDPQWAEKLSDAEARLALRYAPVELNGFPPWLESFAVAHPMAVDEVLGAEVSAELEEASDAYSITLQNIQHAALSVARLFMPRLLTWLQEGKWRLGHNKSDLDRRSRFRQVVEILLQHGDADAHEYIAELALTELKEGAQGPASEILLPTLLSLNPEAGVDAFEKTLRAYSPAKFGPATDLFASLFGDRHGDAKANLLAFTPDLLLRLAKLAYEYIRPADDMRRDSGSYTPNRRDNAERGRSNILNAVLATAGSAGWTIKLALANDPLFADFKDRALAMAKEAAAEEADALPFDEKSVVALDEHGDLPPLTRDEMFALLGDRLGDLEETLLRDDSPRAAWALIQDETIMRQQIAREFRLGARGAYKVDQEAVTADEKETDIRLRSTGSDQEAVIELKIGEKPRSASDLRTTLMDQVVVKYMAAENCRAGCLLITVNSHRTWQHPETGALLDLPALVDFLNGEAAKIERDFGGSLRLSVRGLDLRKRLPTERAEARGGQ